MIPTTITALAPKRATTGTSTTVIAPVGPDTCTFEPPNTAATTPATMAVTSPACAPKYCELLREMRRLDADQRLHLPDRMFTGGEHLQHADAGWVREGTEQFGLRLRDGSAEGGFQRAVRHAETLLPNHLMSSSD